MCSRMFRLPMDSVLVWGTSRDNHRMTFDDERRAEAVRVVGQLGYGAVRAALICYCGNSVAQKSQR